MEHLTEQHQFYLACFNAVVTLVTTIMIAMSHPPGKKPEDK